MAVFVKVAEYSSFKKAAEALALSPSVVSHHVAKLEDRVNAPLLYRNTRNLALTEDGQIFLEAALNMLKAASDGFDTISTRTKSTAGELRVAMPTSLSREKYLNLLAEFESEFPQVVLSLSFSDRFSNHIEDGYDVALVFGQVYDQSLEMMKVADTGRKVVASPLLLNDRPLPKSPTELMEFDWIWLSTIATTLAFANAKKPSKKLGVTIKPRMFVDNSMASRRLALQAMGLTVLPDFVAEEDVEAGRLVPLVDDWVLEPISLYATWPKSAIRASLTHLFIEFLSERLQRT